MDQLIRYDSAAAVIVDFRIAGKSRRWATDALLRDNSGQTLPRVMPPNHGKEIQTSVLLIFRFFVFCKEKH
jgi:hypothetical protein